MRGLFVALIQCINSVILGVITVFAPVAMAIIMADAYTNNLSATENPSTECYVLTKWPVVFYNHNIYYNIIYDRKLCCSKLVLFFSAL